jgi:MOSC domain-containing protein YiiM
VILKTPCVVAVAAAKKHAFRKQTRKAITLMAGLGVEGDAHCGARVQHLYDKARDPSRPNLRQVHLIEQEFIEQLKTLGFDIEAGQLGENVTTRHLSLVELDAGTVLQLGQDAVIEVTGLREPCIKIGRFQKGLQQAVTVNRDGQTYMKAAVMAVVITSGTVRVGDIIQVKGRRNGQRIALRLV